MDPFWTVVFWLIVAHYIADWGLQTEFVANNKGKYPIIMFSHCMVWAGCVSIPLQIYGRFSIGRFLFLLIGHAIMDQVKMMKIKNPCAVSKEDEKRNLTLLYIDQVWHLVQCVIVYHL